jgi:hypothetical protein
VWKIATKSKHAVSDLVVLVAEPVDWLAELVDTAAELVDWLAEPVEAIAPR